MHDEALSGVALMVHSFTQAKLPSRRPRLARGLGAGSSGEISFS